MNYVKYAFLLLLSIHSWWINYIFKAIDCLFHVPQTVRVIWGWDHRLKSHLTDWRSQGLSRQPKVYKVSDLSTTFE